MPTFTPNINLKKPLQSESYNVDDFNGNCDLIDTKIGIMTANKTDNSWKPSLQYLVGDIIYSSRTSDSYKIMECTASGTTGTNEPTWGTIGTTLIDGTVTWIIKRISNNIPYYRQNYLTAGIFTFIAPASGLYKVTVIGGGGGGGGIKSTSATYWGASSGGAGGGTAIKYIFLDKDSSTTVTVGSGGLGGAITPTNGTSGGTSSFGAYCSAIGGGYGLLASATTALVIPPIGFSGGTGVGGDINLQGACGTIGSYTTISGSVVYTGGNSGSSFLNGATNGYSGSNGTSGKLGSGGNGVGGVNNAFVGGNGGDGAVIIER